MHTSLPLRNMPVSFINVQPLNPLISSCDIKVLYHGPNRNRSLISKGTAEKIAATLPNVPIVGEYLEHVEDFGDHAQDMIINDNGVKFVKRTSPYGVVPSNTKIWWQWFIDDDGVEREYMMCQGYLWTGRYPEVNRVLESGNGQSMEFDADTMQGVWAIPENMDTEYFIVSDAVFTGLCILGEDVEPCFEGANIGPVVYALDKDKFKVEMNQFMFELKSILENQEGGNEMPEDNIVVDPVVVETPVVEEPVVETPVVEEPGQTDVTEPVAEPISNVETTVVEDEFANKKKEEEEGEKVEEEDNKEEPVKEEEEDSEDKKKKAKYELEEVVEYAELKTEYDALVVKYEALVKELEGITPELHSLREMKNVADTSAKNSMISKFYMLDEEDLKEVKENVSNYSLEEIESKLSVIAVRKKVNFNLDDTNNSETNVDEPIVSFSAQTTDNIPAWLKAVESVANRK